jgi:flavin reductase (DIM6/NTAB) family NADH-FMN oxidoreductase RutF
MLAVAVSMSAYTHQSLEETGEFVLAWPGAGQEEIIAQAGECSGREVDKFATFELQTVPGQHLGVPLVEGCAAAFECVVVSQLELEDHSVFIGEIMGAHVADPAVAKLENFDGEFAVAQPAE